MEEILSDKKLEWSQELEQVLDLMENTNENLFISGRAGTGKSTLIDFFRLNTKKNCVILAPTGVAALNVKGQTIHSFFGFKPGITPSTIKPLKDVKKQLLYKNIDILIIDEISMARADLIDCVDVFLRMYAKQPFEPFGGIQVVFMGDMYQLPPIIDKNDEEEFYQRYDSPYFFDAKVFKKFFLKTIELEFVYRQKETEFINLLNAIRQGEVSELLVEEINKRVDDDLFKFLDKKYIYLSTTNYLAEKINKERLGLLSGPEESFQGSVFGDFSLDRLPTSENLILKKGAQVMFLINDMPNKLVNGDIGIITQLKNQSGEKEVKIRIEGKNEKIIKPFKWEVVKYVFNNKKNIIEPKVSGYFNQLPIKLAWAVTIHKSQGKTFDKVIVDFGNGTFASGQAYVALSRCRTLEGLILKRPINKSFIFVDEKIKQFYDKLNY